MPYSQVRNQHEPVLASKNFGRCLFSYLCINLNSSIYLSHFIKEMAIDHLLTNSISHNENYNRKESTTHIYTRPSKKHIFILTSLAPDLEIFSDPARSTRLSFPILIISSPSCVSSFI